MFVYVQDPQKEAKRLHSLLCTGQNATETYNSVYDGFFLDYRFLQEKKIYIVGILRIPIYFCPKDSASLL